MRGAPESFATYRSGDGGRTPAQSLAHLGDLYDWALSIVSENRFCVIRSLFHGKRKWSAFLLREKFDDYLACNEELHRGSSCAFFKVQLPDR